MKQVRVTSRIVVPCSTFVSAVPNRDLVDRTVLHDDKDAAKPATVFAQQLKPRWRPRRILEPPKRHLRPLQRTPPALFDRVEKCVRDRLRDQLSSQINVLIIAISAPAPAAATPLRNDSFLATRERKPVIF